jgi:hypothetical protein
MLVRRQVFGAEGATRANQYEFFPSRHIASAYRGTSPSSVEGSSRGKERYSATRDFARRP